MWVQHACTSFNIFHKEWDCCTAVSGPCTAYVPEQRMYAEHICTAAVRPLHLLVLPVLLVDVLGHGGAQQLVHDLGCAEDVQDAWASVGVPGQTRREGCSLSLSWGGADKEGRLLSEPQSLQPS